MAPKNIIFIQYYKTTIGELIIGCFENQICVLDFRYRKMRTRVDKRIQTGLNAVYLEKETPLLRSARLQVKAYLNGTRDAFTLPIKMVGTPFQFSVWNALKTIPYGTTRSYLELAKQIGDKKAVRAELKGSSYHFNRQCKRVSGSIQVGFNLQPSGSQKRGFFF